jgi:hypothetical protein
LEINNRTLTKMKFVLNEDGALVPKDQVGEEEDDKKDE